MKRQLIYTMGAMMAINLATPLVTTQASNIGGHLTAHQANLVGHTKITQKQFIDSTVAPVAPMEPLVARHQGNQISYYIASTGLGKLAYQHAVDNWNQLGVIKLVPTSQAHATITLTDTSLQSGGNGVKSGHDDGVTTYDVNSGMSTCVINVTSSHPTYLAERAANSQHYTQLDATATHELGHALGFAHDDGTMNYRVHETKYRFSHGHFRVDKEVLDLSQQQVMNSGLKTGDSNVKPKWSADVMPYVPLGQRQIAALKTHYGL